MSKDYTPVSCSMYDELEAAALKKLPIEITLNGTRKILSVKDLVTRDQAEYLIAHDVETGQEVVIRLDLVEEFRDARTKKPLGSLTCR